MLITIIGDKMKKVIIPLIVIFFICIFLSLKHNTKTVMEYEISSNIDNVYLLDFSNEVLSTNNFKLKIAPFTCYSYIIRKIYPKYNRNLKKVYTYDFRNIDEGIENFKKDYISKLRSNNLFDEIEKIYEQGIVISKIEIYTTKEAMNKFIKKYPNVKYKVIENYNKV